jgi:hypothetical protein
VPVTRIRWAYADSLANNNTKALTPALHPAVRQRWVRPYDPACLPDRFVSMAILPVTLLF